MQSWDIVGYVYRADTYCPTHTVELAYADHDWVPPTTIYVGQEHHLDVLAQGIGIDRSDERSFDSGNFPKVIFATQDEGNFCGKCHELLVQ